MPNAVITSTNIPVLIPPGETKKGIDREKKRSGSSSDGSSSRSSTDATTRSCSTNRSSFRRSNNFNISLKLVVEEPIKPLFTTSSRDSSLSICAAAFFVERTAVTTKAVSSKQSTKSSAPRKPWGGFIFSWFLGFLALLKAKEERSMMMISY